MMGKFKRGDGAYSKLSSDQKTFIKARVKDLGSMEAVQRIYNLQTLVDRFARSEAKKIY
jgi:hypothetical protein